MMRKEWFEHVKKVRRQMSTKGNPCSHVDAMKKASESWGDIKLKVKKRLERKARKEERLQKKKKVVVVTENTS